MIIHQEYNNNNTIYERLQMAICVAFIRVAVFLLFFFVCVCAKAQTLCAPLGNAIKTVPMNIHIIKQKKNAIKTTQINISMHPDYYSICQLNEYKFRIHNSVDQILSDRFV